MPSQTLEQFEQRIRRFGQAIGRNIEKRVRLIEETFEQKVEMPFRRFEQKIGRNIENRFRRFEQKNGSRFDDIRFLRSWIEKPLTSGILSRDQRFVDTNLKRVAWRSSGVYYGESVVSCQPTYGPGATLMLAVDVNAAAIWFGASGAWNDGDPATGLDPSIYFPTAFSVPGTFGIGTDNNPGTVQVLANFSGPFEYSIPAGFSAL